jgi:CRISPR-associated protein Cst2
MANKKIASLSISGEITLNLHSLNNEGGEGNQILTRQLTIIDKNGKQQTVNGISGDMFKHIHAVYLSQYANETGLALSSYSRALNPNRISADDLLEYFETSKTENKSSADIIRGIVNTCTVCDTHGVLITDKVGTNKSSTNTPRKSTIEFGWTVGIPDKNGTESYVHTKLVADAGTKGSATSSNEGQNIFHRPANHGVYAFICNLDIYRIGFNDIDRSYAISDELRVKRFKAIVKSLISSFLNPKGAMSSTQKPHITDFKGVVSIAHSLTPAPTVSAINGDYRKEIESIKSYLNQMEDTLVETEQFDSLAELTGILTQVSSLEPYKLK